MLRERLLTSAIGIPIGLILIYLGGIPFALAVAFLGLWGIRELVDAIRLRGYSPARAVAFAGLLAILAATYGWTSPGHRWLGPTTAAVFLALIAVELVRVSPTPLENISTTLLAILWVGVIFGSLILLREMPQHWPLPSVRGLGLLRFEPGFFLVVYALGVTWAADTAAYLVGSRYGQRPLCPRISPRKTVEGFVAEVFAAVLVSLLLGRLLRLGEVHGVILGVALGGLGLVGDLGKSLIKREVGIKDFGTFFPGHGGILDRFDGLLFNGPLILVYFSQLVK